jgi:hypothetical protein
MQSTIGPSSAPSCGSTDPFLALSPAEAALLSYLTDNGGEADSRTLRHGLGVANISAAARAISLKLAASGDPRRIECLFGSTVDPVTGRLRPAARWRLTVATLTPAAA